MDQQLRDMFERDDLHGEFDAIVERLGRQRSADDPNYVVGEEHARQVLAAILDKYAGRLDDIPEILLDSLYESGHIRDPDDLSSESLFKSLTKNEKEVATALNGHMSASQTNVFISALQSGNSLVSPRVLAALSWRGLSNLHTLIVKAAEAMLKDMHEQANPEAESREASYEALSEVAPFFPDDDDEWGTETEEERTRRRDTEKSLLDLVNFMHPATPAPAVRQTSKGLRR